jgi:hypothetical protein
MAKFLSREAQIKQAMLLQACKDYQDHLETIIINKLTNTHLYLNLQIEQEDKIFPIPIMTNILYLKSIPSLQKGQNAWDGGLAYALLEKLKGLEAQDQTLMLALKKYQAITKIYGTLLPRETNPEQSLEHFKNEFAKHKTCLSERRDSACDTFWKVIATIFSLGLAAAYGIWSVKGREFSKQVEAIQFEDMYQKKNQ